MNWKLLLVVATLSLTTTLTACGKKADDAAAPDAKPADTAAPAATETKPADAVKGAADAVKGEKPAAGTKPADKKP